MMNFNKATISLLDHDPFFYASIPFREVLVLFSMHSIVFADADLPETPYTRRAHKTRAAASAVFLCVFFAYYYSPMELSVSV